MQQQQQYAEDDIPFVNILHAMGIENYEHSVPIALNEYAERFALEIMKDAKDYSTHANHAEITPEDVKLALKLCDVRVTGMDQRDSVVKELSDVINKKNLLDIVNPDAVLHRYPLELYDQLPHTYIPGGEAYYIKEDENDDYNRDDDDDEEEGSVSDPMEVVVDGVDDSYTNSGKGKPLQQGQQLLRSTKMRFNSNMKGGKKLDPSPGFQDET